ncbi:MAG: citrate/2-methylcitrate synthase [Candidatus Methanomethylophilaceae archaeon]
MNKKKPLTYPDIVSIVKNSKDYDAEMLSRISLLSERCGEKIDLSLYDRYDVRRGLRNPDGTGVLAGLTRISEIRSKETVNGEEIPIDGELFYRGYSLRDLVNGFTKDKRFGFEETTYLLLFGDLPNSEELNDFCDILSKYRTLPTTFVRDLIMKAPNSSIMNLMSRGVLSLYSFDTDPDNISIPNVLRQSLQLISRFPMLAAYSYQAYEYYLNGGNSFHIHDPVPELSTAENILYMLRKDSKYTKLEARILDQVLVLHAEHGGGNNSSFTARVVSSSGTDTYSAISAAMGSLKGPKHGGANAKVCQMMDDIKANVENWKDEEELRDYLGRIIDGKAFDGSGLIYGIGHAVYSKSDPRADILRRSVKDLANEKHREDELLLYSMVERISPELIMKKHESRKLMSANIDFYSGFIYSMLDIPQEMFTPIFAISRISGWCAHRIEELLSDSRIIRPTYNPIMPHREYTDLSDRTQ